MWTARNTMPPPDHPHPAYHGSFYTNRREATLIAARAILERLFSLIGDVHSVVDYGCGTGTWLSVATELGARDVLGIEGPWLDVQLADIAERSLLLADLEQRILLPRRFDLALSLEGAEHLSPDRAASFVSDLCAAADFVLFSAAVPEQGGTNHINEQPQSYWAGLFSAVGYAAFDSIRPVIWNDRRIPVWYRQNMLVFAEPDNPRTQIFAQRCSESDRPPMLDLIHPELYLSARQPPGVRAAAKKLAQAIGEKAASGVVKLAARPKYGIHRGG